MRREDEEGRWARQWGQRILDLLEQNDVGVQRMTQNPDLGVNLAIKQGNKRGVLA